LEHELFVLEERSDKAVVDFNITVSVDVREEFELKFGDFGRSEGHSWNSLKK
jgi:hypothetical protein